MVTLARPPTRSPLKITNHKSQPFLVVGLETQAANVISPSK